MELELRIFGLELLVVLGKPKEATDSVDASGMITEIDNEDDEIPYGFSL